MRILTKRGFGLHIFEFVIRRSEHLALTGFCARGGWWWCWWWWSERGRGGLGGWLDGVCVLGGLFAGLYLILTRTEGVNWPTARNFNFHRLFNSNGMRGIFGCSFFCVNAFVFIKDGLINFLYKKILNGIVCFRSIKSFLNFREWSPKEVEEFKGLVC